MMVCILYFGKKGREGEGREEKKREMHGMGIMNRDGEWVERMYNSTNYWLHISIYLPRKLNAVLLLSALQFAEDMNGDARA